MIFEFELARAEGRENSLQAINMQLVSPRRRSSLALTNANSSVTHGTGSLVASSVSAPAPAPSTPEKP
jgi:hypothetical protein